MKSSFNTMKNRALSAVFVSATALFPLANAAEVAKITVNGMVCAFCVQGIEKSLNKLPQTKAVYVNLDKKIVAVEAKDGQKLDLAKVKEGIMDSGYDVIKVETVQGTSVQAIKAELTGKK